MILNNIFFYNDQSISHYFSSTLGQNMSPYGWILPSKHFFRKLKIVYCSSISVGTDNHCLAILAHISPTGRGKVIWHAVFLVKFVFLFKMKKKNSIYVSKTSLIEKSWLRKTEMLNSDFVTSFFRPVHSKAVGKLI